MLLRGWCLTGCQAETQAGMCCYISASLLLGMEQHVLQPLDLPFRKSDPVRTYPYSGNHAEPSVNALT